MQNQTLICQNCLGAKGLPETSEIADAFKESLQLFFNFATS